MNAQKPRAKIVYDGDCGFCRSSVRRLQKMDWWGKLEYVAGPKDMDEMRLDAADGKTYSGFFAFRQLVLILPVLYVMIPFVYFPGAGFLGPYVYRWIARNRYLFPVFHTCKDGECFR